MILQVWKMISLFLHIYCWTSFSRAFLAFIQWQVELYWNHAPKTCTLDILERQRTRSIMSQKVLRVLRHTQVVYYVVMSCYYSIVRCYCLFYCTQLKYFQDFIRMISVFEVKLRSHDWSKVWTSWNWPSAAITWDTPSLQPLVSQILCKSYSMLFHTEDNTLFHRIVSNFVIQVAFKVSMFSTSFNLLTFDLDDLLPRVVIQLVLEEVVNQSMAQHSRMRFTQVSHSHFKLGMHSRLHDKGLFRFESVTTHFLRP